MNLANHPTSSRKRYHTAKYFKDQNGVLGSSEGDIFKPKRYRTIRHTGGAVGGGKYHAAEVFLAAKTLNVGKGRRQVVMKSDLKSSKP